jgi:hypothetical protein
VKIAQHLNNQIQLAGAIKPNNKGIWQAILHNLTNEQWHAILSTLEELMNKNPTIGNLGHLNTVETGLRTLKKYELYDRCLDMKNHTANNKPIAWKCLMTIREVYNSACGIDLPNADSSRTTNTFKEIME